MKSSLISFKVIVGLGIGTNAGTVCVADIVWKSVPGLGSLISGVAGGAATHGLGDAAIAYFLKSNDAATEAIS